MNGITDLARAVAWYAQNGIPVFPLHGVAAGLCSCRNAECEHPGKHPRTAHGFKDAATDHSQIERWWRQWADANIGVPTGVASDLFVVDVDPRNGGDESFERLIAQHGALPDTAEQITGGGGCHIVFTNPSVPVRKTLAPGIDLKGDGGYIVVAPSIHLSGKRYQWDGLAGVKALLRPAAVPIWLLELSKVGSNHVRTQAALYSEKWLPGQRNNNLTSLGGTMRKRGMAQESIRAALLVENQNRCDPPLPAAEVTGIAESVARYCPDEAKQLRVTPSEAADDWPDPLPIQAELPPVEAFDPGLLPKSLRGLVQDISERMQAPPDFAAAASIVGLAGAVGRRALIQPKALDTTWVVTPNLWGGVIARPGFMKTPTIQAIMQPLRKIEKMKFDEYQAAVAEYERQEEQHTLELAVWKEQFKKASKIGDSRPDRPADLPAKPTPERLLVGDATFEKLHEVMKSNPAGVLVLRDELTGWLAQLERPGREIERAFSLEAWNGDGVYTVDRVGRGLIHVEHVCMSLFGGIQPGRLRSYLAEALRDGPGDDGLIQRFQVLVWPDLPADWKLVDREPDQAALAEAANVFGRLVELPVEPSRVLHFSSDALELFFDWYSRLQRRVRNRELHPALASHLSKYASLMPSLALLFELADQAASGIWSSDQVDLEHGKQAAACCEYLESHAKRLYSCVTTPAMRAAAELAEHIRAGRIGQQGTFHGRDVYRPQWSGLDTPELAHAALRVLVDWDWVREAAAEDDRRPGRPSARYRINPRIRR